MSIVKARIQRPALRHLERRNHDLILIGLELRENQLAAARAPVLFHFPLPLGTLHAAWNAAQGLLKPALPFGRARVFFRIGTVVDTQAFYSVSGCPFLDSLYRHVIFLNKRLMAIRDTPYSRPRALALRPSSLAAILMIPARSRFSLRLPSPLPLRPL